ncbi:MAG: TRAP transporter small permease [Lachnospiraceae bacterium]
MGVLYKIRDGLMKLIGAVTVMLFALMVVVGTYQVVVRYIFQNPSTISEELLTYSFAWMAILAAAYVFGKRDHMRMAFLADKVKGTPKKILELVVELFTFAFAGIVMVYGGVTITKLTMTQVTAALQIPMGYVYLVIPVSGVLIMYFCIVNMIDIWKTDYSRKEEE